LTVFSNAYLRHVTMGWICLSFVKLVGLLWWEKGASSASTKCFVVVCSKTF